MKPDELTKQLAAQLGITLHRAHRQLCGVTINPVFPHYQSGPRHGQQLAHARKMQKAKSR